MEWERRKIKCFSFDLGYTFCGRAFNQLKEFHQQLVDKASEEVTLAEDSSSIVTA